MSRRLTDEQIAAVAAFERQYGRAQHVPPGPRRTRLMAWSGYDALLIQSDAAWMDPTVVVVEADGRMDEAAK